MSEKFCAYSEIESVSRQKFIDLIKEKGFTDPSIQWTASIKVDGAQFSIYVYPDGKIRYSRRNALLKENEGFYNYQEAVKADNLEPKSVQIRKILIEKGLITESSTIIICGELFGGSYNHPDVPKSKFKGIQSRIQYAPGIHFYCFDIMIEKDGNFVYIDDNIVTEVCNAVQMTSHYVVKIGTFDECMAVPNNTPDPIGVEYYGLPPIENNIIEGIVIKPVHPIVYDEQRIILKNKNEIFEEKINKKQEKPKKSDPKSNFTEKELEIYGHKMEYVTESRICSVVSKIGEITKKDFMKLRNEFLNDATKDFLKDYGEEIAKLPKKEYDHAKVDKIFANDVTQWIRPHFAKYMSATDK
ncbi:RNA ligase, Rnl2 family [Histomonas meleagridis]|uniref:RNA ligase, Rnl2 family n=1 Tax=Histomonas meleagridis TaxID=135588 RepID=UPI003559D523|nr:RNA ligase, Rnl2 family [Histomonas meleagridis]KAH0803408.1 RNA ligase, Rnl2 family [Histomonas meleagridis]